MRQPKRKKLQYARVLIEVKIDQDFLEQLSFIHEKGIEVHVIDVSYEWTPVVYDMCKKIGHLTKAYKKSV